MEIHKPKPVGRALANVRFWRKADVGRTGCE